ncbi:MAG: lipid biosynthesis B12-binding/radical SAM protein [Thermoanaerobaculia bacterium]
MASRILLVSTNRCAFPDPVFPLGLAMVDTALRQAGHRTRWLDCQPGTETLEQVLAEFSPDFVGFSLRNIDDIVFRRQETYFGALLDLCQEVRRRTHAPVILGGSGFSIFPQPLLELSGADFGIAGEGESSMVSLIAALEDHGDPTHVPGLVFRRNGCVVSNPRRAMPRDQPAANPHRPESLVKYYLQASSMLNVQTQRGCPFGCCYCTYPMLEGQWPRRRPPEAIAAELEELQRLGARYVFVVDSVFNSSPAHVNETCEAIIRRGVTMRWGCFLRPQGLDAGQMRVMRRAGLTHIEFGSDSFCDPVLAAYGKKFTFDDIRHASELAAAEHVAYCHFLVCGGPGETLETLQQTFENSRRLPGGVVLALAGMRVYPGTPLFDEARRQGLCSEGEDLMKPHYYFAPGLSGAMVCEELNRFSAAAPEWIVNEPNEQYYALARKLRRRGVAGPLWNHLATLQRMVHERDDEPRSAIPSS